eukprot:Skav223146  [mRNA]  locus=scaffold6891:1309:2787:- [translate_table: standard]
MWRQVLSAHSAVKLPWTVAAMRLPLPPKTLIQTHFEDHKLAKHNKEMYADGLTRVFVNDEGCIEDLQALGGSALLAKYRSFPRGAHRADLWRYVRLFRDGGNYLDIKMCLLQPLQKTFNSIYAEGKAMLQVASNMVAEARSKTEGGDGKRQRIAQPIEEGTLSKKQRDRITDVEVAERMLEATLCEDLREQPHLIMSRGANKRHVFQGNILGCSPKHPLIARALADAMSATPRQLDNSYLKFCLFLWNEMERDLQAKPEIGWNFCPTLGPIYLLEERFFANEKSVRVHNEATPVDGHFMLLADGQRYAATRAWGWKNGFLGAALRAAAMGGVKETDDANAGTLSILEQCVRIAACHSHYAGLGEEEISRYVKMGMAVNSDEYLLCLRCKNRKKKPLQFQSANNVRDHFRIEHVEETEMTLPAEKAGKAK